MNIAFDDVPLDAFGDLMLVAGCEVDFMTYIAWLADYLYRPVGAIEAPFDEDRAGRELIAIESAIATAIWANPWKDYPPGNLLPASGARHADILHRREMSEVLSHVTDRAVRIRLVHHFYDELNRDAHK